MIRGSRRSASFLALLLALVLTSGHWTAGSAQAAVKAGKPCRTVGKQVEKAKWVFTCTVRKGKKVWVRAARPPWERVAAELFWSARDRGVPIPDGSFRVAASPSLPSSVVESVKLTIEWSYEPWHRIAPLPQGYPVAIIDRDSRDWYLEFSAQFEDDNCGPGWWERTQAAPEQPHGAVCSGPDSGWSYLVVYMPPGANNVTAFLALHESVHVAQGILASEFVLGRSMECWLGEGMAELYTGALVALKGWTKPSPSATRFYRHMVVGNLRVLDSRPDQIADPSYWLDVIRRSEDRSSDLCVRFGLGYSLGYLVSEKLVADFGEDGLLRWLAETRRSQDPDAAFARTFGLDQDRWYEKAAAPYVAREASKVLVDGTA